ncbi:chorismate mutase [Kutzneria buriramensis]|jgi:chorismate mutase|uniref:Chorismate mutase n=1 Tax=Kutzneria buriramensis TaxID=1045776 RepID=A0A3E0I0W4_9PSEU|nr:chorismate mutase [Kutzneria buriramensis]REH52261.1 chorismate mutase [Kutzneria buriramensis]
MDVRSSSLSRRAALTGLGGVALLAAAACSPSKEATSTQPAGQTNPPATVDPNASIAEQRKIIDGLDKQIIELLKQRGEASATVQKIRTSAGGQKTDPAREQQIISAYSSGLGAGGADVAKAILNVDRGVQPSTSATSTTAPTSTTETSSSH